MTWAAAPFSKRPRSAGPHSARLPSSACCCHIEIDSICSAGRLQHFSANHALARPRSSASRRPPLSAGRLPTHARPRLCCRHAGPGRGRWARLVPNAARCVAIHSSGSVAARAALFGCDSTPSLPGSQQRPRGLPSMSETVASRADYEQFRLSDKLMRVLQARRYESENPQFSCVVTARRMRLVPVFPFFFPASSTPPCLGLRRRHVLCFFPSPLSTRSPAARCLVFPAVGIPAPCR